MPTFGASPRLFGGFAVDRSYFRKLLPDLRWVLRAAGIVTPGDANGALLELGYVNDSNVFFPITAADTTVTGASAQKFTIGPALLFNPTDGYALNEVIPVVRLRGTKATGVDATITLATIWLEQQSGRQ